MSYIFNPDMHPQEIVIIGLGGTGSQLARSACRIVYDMRTRNLQTPRLRFVDPDVVEMKNVGRQMFAAADVGRYKAEVLAKRFSAALGLEIAWYNEPFHGIRHTHQASYGRSTILMGAVDNHLARRAIADASGLWIDCGNHYASGQVVIGNTKHDNALRDSFGHADSTGEVAHLPNAKLVFPQLLEPDTIPTPDLSCADLVQMGEQQLLINDLVADVAAQYLFKVLHRQPIRSFITYIDAEVLSMRSIPITRADVEAYVGPIPEPYRYHTSDGLVTGPDDDEDYPEEDDDYEDFDDEPTGYEIVGDLQWN
jgi:PRTRC genetic system ThiF family protein